MNTTQMMAIDAFVRRALGVGRSSIRDVARKQYWLAHGRRRQALRKLAYGRGTWADMAQAASLLGYRP